jgi:hypothetical protein
LSETSTIVVQYTDSASDITTYEVLAITFKRHVTSKTPPCGQSGWKCVFLSSATYTGDLGGLSGADSKCQALANAAGIGGTTYKAWLSAGTVNAKDRMTIASVNVPYVRIDRKQLAASGPAFLSATASGTTGTLGAAISLDETGVTFTSDKVFTYTIPSGISIMNDAVLEGGLPSPQADCDDWTASTNKFYGFGGIDSALGAAWTAASLMACTTASHIYCFEQ